MFFIIVVGGFVSIYLDIIILIMGVVVVINLYNISPQVQKIRVELNKNKRTILLQRKKIRENEDTLKRNADVLSQVEEKKIMKETSRDSKEKIPFEKEGHLRLEYWEKLEKELGGTPSSVTESTKLTDLRNKQVEIEKMVELSKQKYHRRLLDEQSFREIVKDYQKKLIELESEISKLEGKKKEESSDEND